MLAAPADTLSFAIPLADGRGELAVASVVDIRSWIDMTPAWLARFVIWTADGAAQAERLTRISAAAFVGVEHALFTLSTKIVPTTTFHIARAFKTRCIRIFVCAKESVFLNTLRRILTVACVS